MCDACQLRVSAMSTNRPPDQDERERNSVPDRLAALQRGPIAMRAGQGRGGSRALNTMDRRRVMRQSLGNRQLPAGQSADP
jgi:hypothetical protein